MESNPIFRHFETENAQYGDETDGKSADSTPFVEYTNSIELESSLKSETVQPAGLCSAGAMGANSSATQDESIDLKPIHTVSSDSNVFAPLTKDEHLLLVNNSFPQVQ